MAKKAALGKGLGALIGDAPAKAPRPVERSPQSGVSEIELSKIEVNPFQPRTRFDEEALNELSNSIKQLGLVQPITLRELEPDKYQIISGERRFRASQLAGLTKVPAYVRKAEDQDMLALALVENVQREDLDAIEIAISYQRLMDECQLTQESLSTRVGKKRTTVTNYLRLLKLPPVIQAGLINKDISMGHARTLISIEDSDLQLKAYNEIIEQDLSVRKTEEFVKMLKEGNTEETALPAETKPNHAEAYKSLQEKLSSKFSSKVKFKIDASGKGQIVIPFSNNDELENIISQLD